MSDQRPLSVNPPSDSPHPNAFTTQELQGLDDYNLWKHTIRLFKAYEEEKIQDYILWECISNDLEHYTKEIFDRLDAKTWNIIKKCCYTQGYWLDHGPGKSRSSNMIKAIKSPWYDKWTMDQITYVEKTYKDPRRNEVLSPWVSARKQELSPDINPIPVPPINSQTTTQYHSPSKPDQSNQPQTSFPPLQGNNPTRFTSTSLSRFSRELTQLDKTYREEEKFGGTGDNFSFKTNIFYDKCRRAGVPPTAYMEAASIMLTGQAQSHYYANGGTTASWEEFCRKMETFFEGPEWQRLNLTRWQTININDIVSSNPSLTTTECLRKLITEMNTVQRGLDSAYHGTTHLRENIVRACRGHPALTNGLNNPSMDTSGLVNNLYTSIINYEAIHKTTAQQSYIQDYHEEDELYFTDRQYHKDKSNFRHPYRFNGKTSSFRERSRIPPRQSKKCFVCSKSGCWSTNHNQRERDIARKRFMDRNPQWKERPKYNDELQNFIIHVEGEEDDDAAHFFEENDDGATHFFTELVIDSEPMTTTDSDSTDESFLTSLGEMHNNEPTIIASSLADNAFKHRITTEKDPAPSIVIEPFSYEERNNETTPSSGLAAATNTPSVQPTPALDDAPPTPEPYMFSVSTKDRYDDSEFKGLLIDSGAATRSTGGIGQLKALQRIDNKIILDKDYAGSADFVFGIGKTSSIGVINLDTPVGKITFHIVDVNTPFLLCLADLDKLGAFFNNLTNKIIQTNRSHPVIRRYGHAFLLWNMSAYMITSESLTSNQCYLTDVDLRRLHRRFGHPSVRRLHQVLERSGHDVELQAIEYLTKYCEHCQKHAKSPGRFSFTIKDDIDFNCNVIVDILYIEGKPVLHIVDESTRFQAGRWLENISAKHVWDQLRSCWIDTYLGPPDLITTDAGKQFTSREFKQYAANMGTIIKTVPVEAHHSIGLVERYHGPLRRVFTIITTEIPGINPEMALQMAFKALNDTAGPNGLVPTLLVFGAYPRMTDMDAPSPTITQRAVAIRKAMEEIRRSVASRQINDAINTRNGPSTSIIHNLPLNSPVLVFREGNTGQSGTWTGPFKLLSLQRESVTVELPNGPTIFRSTSVKPYHHDPAIGGNKSEKPYSDNPSIDEDNSGETGMHPDQDTNNEKPGLPPTTTPPGDLGLPPPPRTLLPPDIDSIPATERTTPPIKRGRGRPRKHPQHINLNPDICFVMDDFDTEDSDSFVINEADLKLPQFTASRQKEVAGLLEKNVFIVVNRKDIPDDARIFNSRFVDEVKNAGTDKAFEKSRLVVQAYNDVNKGLVLTQSPTIQRVSQRLIVCLAAIFQDNTKLYLRDVTQAYVQSTSNLNRDFYIRPPMEFATMLGIRPNSDTILKVVKPLYGVPEAGNHWFATYHGHHIDKLGMTQSTYDPCLLYKSDPLGVIGIQTDDTLIIATSQFADDEEEAIVNADIMTKARETLTPTTSLKFNGTRIELSNDHLTLKPEKHADNITLVKTSETSTTSSRGIVRPKLSTKEQYIAQRARGAYLASTCQPEASFDLSYAAQSTEFTPDDVTALNKRLQWQIDNKTRGLRYVKLDPNSLKVVVFTDSSFANNRDLSSQIGFVVCIADKTDKANIIHWSSIKCKRITRSVLAAELYGVAHGFDIGTVIKATLGNILQTDVPLILCTDSRSLYECLVKLGTTQEKRLMIDIMSLRQSYERREITEIKWIHGHNNPADSMTKAKGSNALKMLLDTNSINLETIEWVERR